MKNFLLLKLTLLIAYVHLAHKAMIESNPKFTLAEIEMAKLFPEIDFCVWIARTWSNIELPEAHLSILLALTGKEKFDGTNIS